MEAIRIKYSNLTSTQIVINGYKHAAAMILLASIIIRKKVFLTNVPDIEDIRILSNVILKLNGIAVFKNNNLFIDTQKMDYAELPPECINSIHNSMYLLPVLSGIFGSMQLGKTGGCQIGAAGQDGARPVSHILKVMQMFGAQCTASDSDSITDVKWNGFVKACTIDIMDFSENRDRLTGPLVSGATKTAIFTALHVNNGITRIRNPYPKGDVVELLEFVRKAGYCVIYSGNEISIEKRVINNNEETIFHKIISDPSEIITYVTLSVYNKIPLKLVNVTCEEMRRELRYDLEFLEKIGVSLIWGNDYICIPEIKKIKSADLDIVSTEILSDHQPFYALLLLTGDRKSRITEFVWQNRFDYAIELRKLGAVIQIMDNVLLLNPSALDRQNQVLYGKDLRGVMALIIAAIGTHGEIYVTGIEHIKRGYAAFFENLSLLGVNYIKTDLHLSY